MSTPIAITGAAGRMGRRLISLALKDPAFTVVGAVEAPGCPDLGKDAGVVAGEGAIGVKISTEISPATKLLIDFTVPKATEAFIASCRKLKIAHLIGTTGLTPEIHKLIDEASKEIPIFQSPTMAVGVATLYKLVAEAAKLLGDEYDIEIVEAHHRFKKDAPSGTALYLAESALDATGKTKDDLVFSRSGGDCARKKGEITMQSLRMGDEVGMHTIYFGAPGERLELTHRATSRDTFAFGALRAAKWLANQKPGRYKLSDVLGF